MIMGAGKSEVCRASWQPGNSTKSQHCLRECEFCRAAGWTCRQVGCSLQENSFFFRKRETLLLRPSSDWMKAPHIMEGNLLYSKSADFNVNHI